MTRNEFAVILAKISRFYPRFYEGQDAEKVAEDWYTVGGFEKIPFSITDRAVTAYCNTSKFPPSLADIKAQMVESYLQDKPTAMQAFQAISTAVKKARDRRSATEAYNALPPILRKLVEEPNVLMEWNQVSAESFQTVIMSAIRESYKELATREAKYYAFPSDLQDAEPWRVSTPDIMALPEPEKQRSIDEIIDEANRKSAEHGMQMTAELKEKNVGKVDAFLKPMTEKEIKEFEAREKIRNEKRCGF